ncbi:alanine racemase [Rhodobacter capsulatus]|uniref:alanine racemase n=1 Tax=Rhodobacter capsulatus TaxID=1061 RepID=UPI0006DCABAB|nr:alanine racemase [Rhodobacter capsulatus]KQB17354.1 alanine racemase [Rhodobacter capsulatus]KQB17756.1 alanine racemase [Rhodobacter capsulatus]PZX27229.1 alanine racemase [Rhodobacter capsulatus]QNR64325.1 alanine racemase [Rhodobacter capsulatus]
MTTASLRIDLDAVLANWRALDAMTSAATETGAVVKADSYGLGAARVARVLAQAGARKFFVAAAEEGATVRQALGEGPEIFVFSGHMAGDTEMIGDLGLTPMLNSVEQVKRHRDALPGAAFGVQLDTGMNRLGLEPADWAAVSAELIAAGPKLVMSHLACSDEPEHPMNAAQLKNFRAMTDGTGLKRALSATGGILLGPDYHFDVTRPGIGLYGGLPFEKARPVVRLSLPVVQIRKVAPGETVGYANSWTAPRESRIATVAAGYADGLSRRFSGKARLWAGDTPCPLVGRVSMDLITVDVTDLAEVPQSLDILGPHQGVDALAEVAGTIGYEILTALGQRYQRAYVGGLA